MANNKNNVNNKQPKETSKWFLYFNIFWNNLWHPISGTKYNIYNTLAYKSSNAIPAGIFMEKVYLCGGLLPTPSNKLRVSENMWKEILSHVLFGLNDNSDHWNHRAHDYITYDERHTGQSSMVPLTRMARRWMTVHFILYYRVARRSFVFWHLVYWVSGPKFWLIVMLVSWPVLS